jgi:hypothetical protein
MYCPSCGTEAHDQTKYCTKCGVNLRRVKGVLGKGGAVAREVDAGADSSCGNSRADRRSLRKKTPEEKRLNEIKGGVITTSVGLGLIFFLHELFDAIANSVQGPESEILRSLWAVGLIPFLIGLGVLFNGLIVSRRIVELKRRQEQENSRLPLFSAPNTSPVARLAESSQPPISDFSIGEPTTTKLREPVPVSSPRDAN